MGMARTAAKWMVQAARSRRDFIGDRRGGVLVEFAFLMPILVFVMLGSVDVIRFAMLQQKLNRAAASMSDLVSQYQTMSQGQLDQLFLAMENVVTPFPMGAEARVIVSSISKADSTAPVLVNWQRFGAGTATATSKYGAEGATATLPTGFVVNAGENVIVAEVFYDFTPLLFTGIVPARRVEHAALNRPRFGALDTLDP